MALVTRLSRLFKADFNAVLDQIEEPELLLRQAIRDMENDLACQEQQHKRLVHEQEQLVARKDGVDETLVRLDEELDVCFESGNDDLARTQIRRKLETQRLGKQLDSRLNATRQSLARQTERLEHNRTTLESMRQKAELFTRTAEETSAGSPVGYSEAPDDRVDDHDVEVAFLSEKSRRCSS